MLNVTDRLTEKPAPHKCILDQNEFCLTPKYTRTVFPNGSSVTRTSDKSVPGQLRNGFFNCAVSNQEFMDLLIETIPNSFGSSLLVILFLPGCFLLQTELGLTPSDKMTQWHSKNKPGKHFLEHSNGFDFFSICVKSLYQPLVTIGLCQIDATVLGFYPSTTWKPKVGRGGTWLDATLPSFYQDHDDAHPDFLGSGLHKNSIPKLTYACSGQSWDGIRMRRPGNKRSWVG